MKLPRIQIDFTLKRPTLRRLFGCMAIGAWLAHMAGTFIWNGPENSGVSTLAFALYIAFSLPWVIMMIINIRQLKREGKKLDRDIQRLHIELVVHETLLKIFDPEGYEKAKSEIDKRMRIAELFNAKSGPKEK